MAESIGLVRKIWVAGSMGPTSKSLSLSPDASDPAFRPYSFDDLKNAYREQAEALAKGGVDLFIIENTFDNAVLRGLHGFVSLAIGFLYSCRKFFYDRKVLARWQADDRRLGPVFTLKRTVGFLVAFMSLDRWTRLWDRWNSLCRNGQSKWVTIPVGRQHYFREMGLRTDMCETRPAVFEGFDVKVPQNVEEYLVRLYGPDYMTPPPAAGRERHVFFPPFELGEKDGVA